MPAFIYDQRPCELGEGPLWHPERKQFFWFDIYGRKLLSRDANGAQMWQFDRMASAAGWVDRERLLVATETSLDVLDLRSGGLDHVADLEADNSATRSNDGRADRQGGFWIGTMGKDAETGAGAIYRYYRGELRRLVTDISIPNAICFSADGRTAFYADTAAQKLWQQPLDDAGWPVGDRGLLIDFVPISLFPDGAVTDSGGAICVACWGASAVIRFGTDGQQLDRFDVGGQHSSCPALGGEKLLDMLVTSARTGIAQPDDDQGMTYMVKANVPGLPEPRVEL